MLGDALRHREGVPRTVTSVTRVTSVTERPPGPPRPAHPPRTPWPGVTDRHGGVTVVTLVTVASADV